MRAVYDNYFTVIAFTLSILSNLIYVFWIYSKYRDLEKKSYDQNQITEHVTMLRNISFAVSMVPFAFILLNSVLLLLKLPESFTAFAVILLFVTSSIQFSIEKRLRKIQASKTKNLILQLRTFFSVIFFNLIYVCLSGIALNYTDDFLRFLGVHPAERATASIFLVPFIILACLFVPFYFSPFLVRLMLPSKKIADENLLSVLKQELSQAGLPSYQCYSLELDQFGNFNALVVGTSWGKGLAAPSIFISKSLFTQLTDSEFRSIIRHEIGHLKLKHMRKRFITSFLAYLVPLVILFSILFLLLPNETDSVAYMISIVCAMLCQMFLLRRQVRYQEMEADAYAIFNLGSNIEDFENALKKLSVMNNIKYNKKELSSLACAGSAHPTSDFRVSELYRRQNLKSEGKPLFAKNEWYQDLLVGTPRLVLSSFVVLFVFSSALFAYQEWPKFSLHKAIANGDIESVQSLIKKGVSYEAKSIYSHGKTPLYTAIENNKVDIAQYLIKTGVHFRIDKDNSLSYLSLASNRGHLDSIKLLLANDVDVNEAPKSGKTALIYAAENGHLEIVKYLHNQGAKLDYKVKGKNRNALLLASKNGHLDVVKYLIENGFDVNTKDTHGSTPLLMASYYGYKDIAEYLISHKASLNEKDNDGDSALKMAHKEGFHDFEKLLLSAGAKDERSLRRIAEQ